jgi:hypothetical protein
MTSISIPREKVLELIKKDTCNFYERSLYLDITIDIVFDSYTELKGSILELTFKDLANLLFDKVVIANDGNLVITVC